MQLYGVVPVSDCRQTWRTSSKTIDGPQKLQKNSKTREAIYELMILYNKKLREAKLCDFEDRALMALDFIKNNTVNKYTHILIDESQIYLKFSWSFLFLFIIMKNIQQYCFHS